LLRLTQTQDNDNPWGWNEIVLEPASVAEALPHSVLAIFYTVFSHEDEEARAREVHRAFVASFPEAAGTPLLVFDKEAVYHPERGKLPFTIAPPAR
jgi:hypothetical protein